MRISTRLRLGVYIPAVMALVVAITLVFAYRETRRVLETEETVGQIRSSFTELSSQLFSYVLSNEESPKQQFLVEDDKLTGLLAAARMHNAEQQLALDEIRQDAVTIKETFIQLVSTRQGGASVGTDQSQQTEDMLVRLLLAKTREAGLDTGVLLILVDEYVGATQIRTTGLILIVMLFATVLVTIVLARTRRSIASSLSNLTRGAGVIGAGNLDFRIEGETGDEMGELAQAFNRMTAELQTVTASKADLEREIGERTKAEAALNESEEQYRSLFTHMSSGCAFCQMVFDEKHNPVDFIYVEVNEAFERLTGLNRGDVVGKSVTEVIPGINETNPEIIPAYGKVVLTGEPNSFEVFFQPLNAWLSVIAYRPKEGYFVSVFDDITARKRAEEHIMASLREKETLLKEIHHRVKNNLQIIHSMLNLQLPQVKDPVAIALYKESQNRVYTMALIHEKLYQSESLSRVDLAEYMRSLVSYLFASYSSNAQSIKRTIDAEDITLGLDTLIPCALIVNELVSNSLKHAFPPDRLAKGPGTVSVSLRHAADNRLVLAVADDGIGLPSGFDIQNSRTMGLKLVSILTGQLGGTVSIDTSKGTEFVISFDGGQGGTLANVNSNAKAQGSNDRGS